MFGHLHKPVSVTSPSGAEVGEFDLAEAIRATVPFDLASVKVSVGGSIERHSHRFREIWVLTHGRGTLTVDGEQSIARAGDILYFESHQDHDIVNDGGRPIKITAIWWEP